MRVYVDIDNFKAENIQKLYVYAVTKDRRAITVGGDMMVWCVDRPESLPKHFEEEVSE